MTNEGFWSDGRKIFIIHSWMLSVVSCFAFLVFLFVKLVLDIIKFLMMENLTPHDTRIH